VQLFLDLHESKTNTNKQQVKSQKMNIYFSIGNIFLSAFCITNQFKIAFKPFLRELLSEIRDFL